MASREDALALPSARLRVEPFILESEGRGTQQVFVTLLILCGNLSLANDTQYPLCWRSNGALPLEKMWQLLLQVGRTDQMTGNACALDAPSVTGF